MNNTDSLGFTYLDYHCSCIPANFSIQYPLEYYYSVPLRCMTCMQVVEVKTEEVVAKNILRKEENYRNLKVDKQVFTAFKLQDDLDDFGW